MKEIWKTHQLGVKISNTGRCIGKKGKEVFFVKKGYRRVMINGKLKRVHHLVWELFGDGRKYGDGLEINHIDRDKLNNSIENLELVTHAENMAHALNGENHHSAFLCEDDIYFIRINPFGFSQKTFSELYNCSSSQISKIIKNKQWAHIAI